MLPTKQVGIKDEESVVVRITGCPNGCARPYMAEVGFVGDGPNSYQVKTMLKYHVIISATNLTSFSLRISD